MGALTGRLRARFPPVGAFGGSTVRVPAKGIATALAPIVIAGGVAAAATRGMLPLALAASALLILLLIGLRSPIFVLVLLAALVPLEDTLVLSGAGTATRFVGVVFAAAYVANRRQLPRLSTMPAAGWAFVLWAVASALWVVDFAAWADAILTLLQMFALALLVGDLVSRDPPAARKVMWAYSVSAVVTVFVLVAVPSEFGGVGGSGRLTAFSGQDPAQFAAVLLPAFLFLVYEGALAASRRDSGPIAALLILAGAGLVVWGALESGTRSAVVGFGVGLAAMMAIGVGHRRGRLMIAAVGLAAAGAALLSPGVVDSVLMRFSDAVSTGGAGRLDIWAVGATIFALHPLLGVGYAAFPAAFTSDVIRISALPGLELDALASARAPHSILVGTAAELGIIGIVVLGLFLWGVLSARSSLGLSSFVRAAVVAMLAQAMFLDVLDRKQLWLVLGIAVGLAAATRVQEAGAQTPRSPRYVRQTSAGPSRTRRESQAAHAPIAPPSEVAWS